MTSSVTVAVVVPGEGASPADPLPYILGDNSSESKSDATGASSAAASTSKETTSIKFGRSAKAQHLEESEAEFEERSSSILPQGLEAASTLPRAMGIGASGFIAEPLHLGNSILIASCILLVFVGLLIFFLFVS